jgi:hypothetical protein
VAGQTVPNAAIVRAGADGTICLYSTATAHVVVDVQGYLTAAFVFQPGWSPALPTPSREFDTRVDGNRSKLPAGQEIVLDYGWEAVVLNLTVTQPDNSGFITVFACGEGRPWASNLNYVRGQTVANLVLAPGGAEGICIYTTSTTHILGDIQGSFVSPSDVPR